MPTSEEKEIEFVVDLLQKEFTLTVDCLMIEIDKINGTKDLDEAYKFILKNHFYEQMKTINKDYIRLRIQSFLKAIEEVNEYQSSAGLSALFG